jgi:hypothetical protein
MKMQTPQCLIENFADEEARIENQERFKEEVSQAIFELMDYNEDRKADLARRLDCSPARVSQMLGGSHNFTLETVADVFMALGRAAHLSLDLNTTDTSNAFDAFANNGSDWPQNARAQAKHGLRKSRDYPELLTQSVKRFAQFGDCGVAS